MSCIRATNIAVKKQ